MAQSHNRILDSLPQNVYAALSPHLKTVNLPFAQIVAEPEKPSKPFTSRMLASSLSSWRWKSAT